MWLEQDDYNWLGQVLAELRGATTQSELAAQLGKPQSFVSSYENGQRRVDLLEFLRIASALKVDPVKVFAKIARKSPSKASQKK